MAKGQIFWGNARGKLGQTVLSTVKGQQIVRAYQPQVANPRTTAQTDQRITFANAVKFYKHGTKALFEFAYEDKKQTESYYNAFMRYNSKVSMLPTRTSYDNDNYPAIGNQYLLSNGSLPELEYTQSDSLDAFELKCGKKEGVTNATIADVSECMINEYKLVEGDIITLVYIIAQMSPNVNDEPTKPVDWYINQFVIDTTDTREFVATLTQQNTGGKPYSLDLATGSIRISGGDNLVVDAFAAIASRKTTSGLKVSKAYLLNGKGAKAVYDASLQTAYRNAALNSWGRTTTPILKGSIAEEGNV